MPCETKRKISKGTQSKKEKNKTQKYHKAVLKKAYALVLDIYFQITKLNLKYVLA